MGSNFTTFVLIYEYNDIISIMTEKPEIPIANAISSDCIKVPSNWKIFDSIYKAYGSSFELFDT